MLKRKTKDLFVFHVSTPYYLISVVLMKMTGSVNKFAAQHNTGQMREAEHDDVRQFYTYAYTALFHCFA